MYILLTDKKTVMEIIPDEDPVFPGVPISARYAPSFVAKLLHVDDATEAEQNWLYDPETGVFSAPPEPEPVDPEPEADPEPGQPTLSERVTDIENAIERGLSL